MSIRIFNRAKSHYEVEKVYGGGLISFLYDSWPGRLILPLFYGKTFSKFYGHMQNLRMSRKKIPGFIANYDINISEFEPETHGAIPYKSFNQFFSRKFKKNARRFVQDHEMAAFAEARYSGFSQINPETLFPVKGKYLSAGLILNQTIWQDVFADGPILIARLCPADYHRFHFPDDGIILDHYPAYGKLHSVNPIALSKVPDILCTNERHITIMQTQHFGKLAYIEVGASCVGKIVQTHPTSSGAHFERGKEKGYFQFGGSTIIVLGEKNKWRPADDIERNSKEGVETLVRLGDAVATAIIQKSDSTKDS